jgi:hypothetical protein
VLAGTYGRPHHLMKQLEYRMSRTWKDRPLELRSCQDILDERARVRRLLVIRRLGKEQISYARATSLRLVFSPARQAA